MKRGCALPVWMGLQMATASSDPSNLEGGVFIAHHPPGIQYSQGLDWCARYWQEFAIDSCSEQHNRLDLDGNEGQSSIWYVLAAWTEEKQWCGAEFGFGEYDPDAYAFIEWGPCSPGSNLEVPTDNWPGPNEGTAVTTTDTAWSGNFVPVYWFSGYAYYEGVIPLAVDPATGFGGTGNCATPPESWTAAEFGGMGIFTDGICACPEGGFGGGGGDGAGEEGGGGEGQDEYPGGDEGGPGPLVPGAYVEDVVIIRFAPDVISFPQDRDVDPQYFRAPLSDASIALPALRSGLEELGAESFATLAPSWRHLDANPSACRDVHGNPIELVDFTNVYRVTLSGVASADDVIAALWHQPGLIYVEPDLRIPLYSCPEPPFPGDPWYGRQWYFDNGGYGDTCLAGLDLNVPEAWQLCDCCGAGTKIAFVDDGVNDIHEDLKNYIDATLSASFVPDPEDPLPWRRSGEGTHGTKCASLAAAGTHNVNPQGAYVGMASISNLPASHDDRIIVALRAGPGGLEDPELWWSGAVYALNHVCGPLVNDSIRVVSNSWGLGYHKYCYRAFNRSAREAFRNAYRHGVSLVCASGNRAVAIGDPCAVPAEADSAFSYPAAFPDYCLAVAGVDCDGGHMDGFFTGSYIDVAGPVAKCITAGGGTNLYFNWQETGIGTSGSAPVIAGAIALLLGEDPNLTNEDCHALLKLSAERTFDELELDPLEVGAGIPQLDRAMTWLTSPCRVVHGSTSEYEAQALDQDTVQFRNVEGITVGEDTWESFRVVPYRLESVVWLPPGELTQKVWTRGRGSSGWRLIDEHLDGNPTPGLPPRYDGLFYDNWARVAEWDTLSGRCEFESYTYKVLVNEEWVWVPFEIGGEYHLEYSYVCCDPAGAGDALVKRGLELEVVGSPVAEGRSVLVRLEMPSEGKVWLGVYGVDGRLVQGLAEAARVAAGPTELRWDLGERGGQRVASGIYFLRLRGVLAGSETPASGNRIVVVR